MKIEEIVNMMTEFQKKNRPRLKNLIPQPVTEENINSTDRAFRKEFGHGLPDAYKRILRRSNGVVYNGLVIWPATPEPLFDETIQQANADLRSSFSDHFLYYGQSGEELYVFDLKSQKYCAREYVGKPVWMEFSSDEEMFQFMLERAWDSEE